MPGYALGLIETEGLPAAIEATDAALKSANVRLIGYELATRGIVTVKIEGEVSAIDAAVRSGSAAASKVNQVLSALVIARPGKGLDLMILSEATVGNKASERTHAPRQAEDELAKETVAEPLSEPVDAAPGLAGDKGESLPEEDTMEGGSVDTDSEPIEEAVDEDESDAGGEQAEVTVEESTTDEETADEGQDNVKGEELDYTCNLCHDPLCTRKKGQPRASCIHYEKI